jgi:hypothetical protein
MIRLDELERHAKAYLPDDNRRAHPAHIQAYYGHCGPEAMLALIKVARAAKAAWKQNYFSGVDERTDAERELSEALKWVE